METSGACRRANYQLEISANGVMRHFAAKDRTFKTVRPNQGTGYGRFR